MAEVNNKKTILITIDDGFQSFYDNAWPILKEKKIPFILFVNTREVGSFNYMNWDQIKEMGGQVTRFEGDCELEVSRGLQDLDLKFK